MKKTIIALGATLATLALVACDNGSNSDSSSAPPRAPASSNLGTSPAPGSTSGTNPSSSTTGSGSSSMQTVPANPSMTPSSPSTSPSSP